MGALEAWESISEIGPQTLKSATELDGLREAIVDLTLDHKKVEVTALIRIPASMRAKEDHLRRRGQRQRISAPRGWQKVAEVVARREGSPFSVAILTAYGEQGRCTRSGRGARARGGTAAREHARPFRGALVDPLFELCIAQGRR